jgi:xanthine dehydrogenase accessory factor
MMEPSPTPRLAAPKNPQNGFGRLQPVDPSISFGQPLTLVRSAGNVGSAVARAIHQAHLPVILLQDREMTTLRWQMAFAPALTHGSFDLQGVSGRCVRLKKAPLFARSRRGVIPLVVASMRAAIDRLAPAIIVDACIKGEREPRDLRGLAPLTIGIGPHFSAGGDVDLVIESAWGARLGAVIASGSVFRTDYKIGDTVQRRSVVGTIEGLPVTAPISGTIRGLLLDGVEVRYGEKFVEIDPRSSSAQFSGVGERPAKIAAGVLNAIRATLSSHGTHNNQER